MSRRRTSHGTESGPPPRLLSRLLAFALPSDVRDGIVGDMEETYRRKHAQHGSTRLVLWYVTQSLALALRFLPVRVTDALGVRMGISWLDLKLGLRMLVKHPGLTAVGTLALTAAITTVMAVHSFAALFLGPDLPVPDGDRVVGIWNIDVTDGRRARQTVGDMMLWRDEVSSVEDIGAFATYERSLAITAGEVRSLRVAELSTVVLGTLGVAPQLGRLLLSDDEQPSSPATALIGFDLWRSAFSADSSIVGQTIRLGGEPRTVVGVMPKGFRFPINEQVWIPAILPSTALQPGEGPPVGFSVGRLADGATMAEAEAELTAVGVRLVSTLPETHERLRPRIAPYTQSYLSGDDPSVADVLRVFRALILVVLIIASVNVGVLVYARTAARTGELSIRNALGASRPRLAVQLFAEGLVLSSLAGALGYGAAALLLRWVIRLWSSTQESFAYWWDGQMSPTAPLLLSGLVFLSAIVTGVLPALGVTSRGIRSSLQRIGAGDSGLSFGRAAAAVVIGQVAVSVASLTLVAAYLRPFVEDHAMHDGIARDEYLTAEVRLDRGLSRLDQGDQAGSDVVRDAEVRGELGRRVRLERGVQHVTFGTSFPGMEHPVSVFRAQGVPLPYAVSTADRARVAWVEPGYFEAFDIDPLFGRTFRDPDTQGSTVRTAIVNQAFAGQILRGARVLGRLVRLGEEGDGDDWAEIVGVVPDLAVDMGSEPGQWPTIYFPLVGNVRRVHVAVRIEDNPAGFSARLRSIAREVDPFLVIHRPGTLEDQALASAMVMYVIGAGIILLVVAALVLSTAGVYSLMSFTVAQRRREIGIRCALGADHKRVVREVLTRATTQVAVGIAIGAALGWLGTGNRLWQEGAGPVVGIGATMLVTGFFACGHPIIRALRIAPTEALQEG